MWNRRGLETAAHHEAGHAVVALLEGFHVRSVELERGRYLIGFCTLAHRPSLEAAHAKAAKQRLSARERAHVEAAIRIHLAGGLAEIRLRGGRGPGGRSDRDIAKHEIESIARGPAEERAYFRLLSVQTANMLARVDVWRAVRALAAELMARSRVGGKDVSRLGRLALKGDRRQGGREDM